MRTIRLSRAAAEERKLNRCALYDEAIICQFSGVSKYRFAQKNATYEWIESDKIFHIMRDHPYHKFPILGGQWGVKKNDKYDMKKLIMDFYKNKSQNKYGTDYEFFIQVLYPLIKEDCMEHDEFFGGINFPDKRDLNSKGPAYVGEPFGGQDELCFPEHREILKRYLNENK